MSSFIIYDKVSWHYPEGINCPNLATAKEHFASIMKWLKNNDLLSVEGKEILGLGIDSDFSITSSMLNKKGNEVLMKSYNKWLESINYQTKINYKALNEALNNL